MGQGGTEGRSGSNLFAPIILAIVSIDLVIALYAVFEAPIPVKVALGTPMAYKNMYLHVPIAVSTYIVLAGAMISSILYLWKGSGYARLAESYVRYGLLFGAATLITGSMWASESWGTPWNWDPKETAVLLLFLAYLGYIPLKNSIPDPDRADRVASVYAIAAFILVPLSFLASRVVESLHPTTEAVAEFVEGGPGGMILGLRITLLSLLGILIPLARVKYRIVFPRWIPVAIIVVGVATAVYLAAPLTAWEYYRVVDASVEDGMITSVTLSNGDRVVFNPPVESPVKPAVARDGSSSIIGHIVRISGNNIEVLYHWSTPATFLVYTILVAVAIYIAGVRR